MKNKEPNVAIILGFYNGNEYIKDQLVSIFKQLHKRLHVYIFDDFSSKEFPNLASIIFSEKDLNKISYSKRPSNIGFAKNFFQGLKECGGHHDYYAFSDQDDIWHSDKISNALIVLDQHNDDKPALYLARTAIISENAKTDLGMSPLFKRTPSFMNALVQSIGGGNTMVFNKAARNIIVSSTENIDVVSHDWWCYQIISGAGGIVHYDPEPCLKYRQHSENLVGANNGWAARFIRIWGMLNGNFHNWNDINLEALSKNKGLLTPNNRECLDDFITARQSGLLKRLFLLRCSGVYRQTLFGNFGLVLSSIINKV